MNVDKIVKVAAIGFVGLVVIPTVVGAGVTLITKAGCGIYNLVQKAKWNKTIKEGLKDGSIVEINGRYFQVEKND